MTAPTHEQQKEWLLKQYAHNLTELEHLRGKIDELNMKLGHLMQLNTDLGVLSTRFKIKYGLQEQAIQEAIDVLMDKEDTSDAPTTVRAREILRIGLKKAQEVST